MSETVDPGGAPPADVPGEAPATDAPGDKINVCPACGTRYDEPTMCSNGHEPTQTVEYDRATLDAAAAGDAEAAQKIADASAAAGVGDSAGLATASAESLPPGAVPAPVPAEPVQPASPAVPVPAAAAVAAGDVGSIFADFEAAISAAVANAKSALGL